jgi:hypothetical protein
MKTHPVATLSKKVSNQFYRSAKNNSKVHTKLVKIGCSYDRLPILIKKLYKVVMCVCSVGSLLFSVVQPNYFLAGASGHIKIFLFVV